MAIEIYEGVLGGGKSYHAVKRAAWYLAQGGHVYTNIILKPEAIEKYCADVYGVKVEIADQYHFIPHEQMSHIHKVVVGGSPGSPVLCILDELHLWHNARDWASADKAMLLWLTQTRKVYVDIIIITQHSNNVDKQWLRLTAGRYRFRDLRKWVLPVLGIKWPLNQFLSVRYDQDGKTVVSKEFEGIDKRIFSLYDSDQLFQGSIYQMGMQNKKLQRAKRKMNWKTIVLIVLALGGGVFWAMNTSKKNAEKYATIQKPSAMAQGIQYPPIPGQFVEKIVRPYLIEYTYDGRVKMAMLEGQVIRFDPPIEEPSGGLKFKRTEKRMIQPDNPATEQHRPRVPMGLAAMMPGQ